MISYDAGCGKPEGDTPLSGVSGIKYSTVMTDGTFTESSAEDRNNAAMLQGNFNAMSDDAESTFSGNKNIKSILCRLLSSKVLGVNLINPRGLLISKFFGEVIQPVFFFLTGRELCL